VERPRDPFDLIIGLREDSAELRATVGHVQIDISDLRHDVRRLDDRLFQMMLLQVGTLATALASLVAALAS
jgi:hypothetical protein